jgi:two-component system sensor histidine kinase VanS
MKSIRTNLFILFAALMTALIAVIILFNVFFLEKYYIFRSRQDFADCEKQVETILAGNRDVMKYLREIDHAEGFSITIANPDFTTQAASYPQEEDSSKLPKEITDLIDSSREIKTDKAIYTVLKKENSQPKLMYLRKTEAGQYIIVEKQMKGISESVAVANQFYVMIGVIALLIGSFVMFRFADRVTQPVIEMSRIANSISKLDFEKKVSFQSEDELGTLAASINMLSDRLRASIDDLKKDIEFQKTLSRNLSHELKTPIGVIKGYAEGLKYGLADTEEKKENYLGVMIGECDRMDELVKEILLLSRLSAKDFVLKDKTEFTAGSIFSAINERFAYELEGEQIKFLCDIKNPAVIYGNYDLIFHAVTNLFSNAVKYNDDRRQIELSASETDSETVIRIFNTCAGIPEGELLKIFDEFYKIDPSRSREEKGHGLGLSIVRSVAVLHGGCVSARNKDDGVEFELIFPKKRN